MKKYQYSKNNIAVYQKAWINPQFGGNVFKPLGSMKKNAKGVLVA